MQTIVFIFVFVFGTIIGSFLNVVIYRHGTGRGLGGRSKCAVTGKTLQWFELIPIVSFLIQGGRSRYSKTKISWQYPLVEFFTGLMFLLTACKFFYLCSVWSEYLSTLVFYFTIWSFFILIFVYDLRHKFIPDVFIYPLMALSFVGMIVFPENFNLANILHMLLAGVGTALPILLLFALTRGRGMGFGDVLLAFPIGVLLGLSGGLAALLMAFWIGAIVGLLLLLKGRKMKSEIPFGPFLILGFALGFLYNIDMNSIASFFATLI